MRAARRFENPRKIKRPGGDFARGYDTAVFGASSYFVWVNRGKESVILDLARSQDKARLRGRWRSPTCLAAGYVKGS